MQKPSYSPYVYHTVKALPQLTVAERKECLAHAGYNVWHLKPSEIEFDLHTDSSMAAHSDLQMSKKLLGDTAPDGYGASGLHLRNLLSEVFSFPYIVLLSQGRTADMAFSQFMAKPGTVIPGNMTFMTSQYFQSLNGAKPVSVIGRDAFDLKSEVVFKGNVDLERLAAVLADESQEVSFVNIELSSNAIGGYPISMANLLEVSRLARAHQVPLILDSTRILENAQFIKLYETGYAERSIAEIVREISECADGCVMSLKKNFLTQAGAFIGVRSEALYLQVRDYVFMSGSEISGPEMEVITQGIREAVLNDTHIEHRLSQTKRLFDQLKQYGVPVVEPYSGYGVWVEVAEFAAAVPADQFPHISLLNTLYVNHGIRIGMASIRQADGSSLPMLRLALPHRLYDNSHIDYIAAAVAETWNERHLLRGYELVNKDDGMFSMILAHFKPLES